MTDRLTGKVTIVTGATRGIGRAIAEAFCEEGAVSVATGRAAGDASFGPKIDYKKLDVSQEADWQRVVDEVLAEHGHIDALVNNAGIIYYEPVHELSLADWHKVVAVNQTAIFLGMRQVVPHMITQGGGSIINVSSIWGNAAVSGALAYHATKGAVRNMSKNAAVTYAKENVRVNSLHPGFIWTPLTQSQDPDINDYVVSQTPMGRAGSPAEIAAGAVFLAADESSFMTGSELVIDGGYLAQ